MARGVGGPVIGRFAQEGIYRELARSWDTYRVAAGGALAVASYVCDRGSHEPSTLGAAFALAAICLNGAPILWGAALGLLRRRVNVDELVSLAIVASVVQGEFLTAAVVSFVMVLGALIEEVTSDSARRAIRALISVFPDTATRLIEGKPETVAIGEVKVGDRLLVKPGDRLPVDAVIKSGVTAVDESSLTGEPMPLEKTVGEEVFAGTLNQNGVIEIEATKVGSDTTLGKVVAMVSEAESHKPEAIKIIDRYAGWFTPVILACAVATWLVTTDLDRAVAVLIVGCPCALILAAPTAIVAAIARAARAGILVKGGKYLEEAGRTDVILFDKTGTLTEGKPRVDEIVTVEGFSLEEVLARAASVEQNSTHPLAYAVLKAAHYAQVAVVHAEEVFTEIGLGVRGLVHGRRVEVGSAYIGGGTMSVPLSLRPHLQAFKDRGATPLVVFEDREPLGIISVADHVRPAARRAVSRLEALGIRHIGLLSGDHEQAARMVADSVGVKEVWAEQSPEDKLQVILEKQRAGHVVMFIGDGINDAPALTSANIGVAMGAAGTDVALETADIALMNDDISKLPFLIQLSRRMLRTIKWNIAFGLAFNALAVIASGGGLLTPIMGAVVHNIGSVLVVMASASLAFTAEP